MTKPRNLSDLLPSVDIPLLQPPISGDVENSDGGIGLRHVEHPLVVHIDRPEATPPGTFFQLYWGSSSQPVAFNLLLEGDEGLTRIPFTVSQSHIREAWADPVFVRVLRGTGNPSETKPLRLRVNLRRPGGRDPNDGEPGHQGLVFELPPDVLLDGISETRARQGVIVTFRYWENMAAYDLITLAWGSQIITRRVDPHEVGQDIQVLVDYGSITEAGNSDLTPVAFQVMGPTGNYPDEWARWSAAQLLDVHLDSNRLDAPWVEFPITERDIDLEQLGNRKVVIGLYIGNADANTYSLVTLIWAGTDRDGGSIPYTPSEVLFRTNRTYYFDIPSALVAAIAQGTVVVHYLLQGADGILDKRSDNRHLRVIGEVIKWPAPTIDQAIGNDLAPDQDVTVRFPFQETWPGAALLEVVFVTGGSENTIEHRVARRVDDVPPTATGDMEFPVYRDELQRFDGYLTEVYYAVTRFGEDPQESLRLKIQVGEPIRELPEPIVENVVDGQLNPDDVPAGVNVTAPFANTQVGDRLTLYWVGEVASSPPLLREVSANGQIVDFTVAASDVSANIDSSVRVFYTLEREGQAQRYSHVTTVLISRASLELLAPELDKAISTGPGTATLAPLDAEGGAKLVVSYAGMLDSDTIQVTMRGTAGAGSPPILSKPGNEATEWVEFDIAEMAIASNIHNRNNEVAFDYTVTRNREPQSSQTLFVTVTPIPSMNLPQPLINNVAPNGILDVVALPTTAKLTVGKWPFQYSGVMGWLLCRCAAASPATHIMLSGSPLLSSNGFEINAPIAWLNTCPGTAQVSVEFKVAYDPNADESGAVMFRTTHYFIKGIVVPSLVIDQTRMHLNGFSLKVPAWPRTGADSLNNTQVRVARGGVPPYSYSSSAPLIASVDAITGKVSGNRNGGAVIRVIDNAGSTLTYLVEVTNVWKLNVRDVHMTALESIKWMESIGGRSLGAPYFIENEVSRDVTRVYRPLPSRETLTWLCAIATTDPGFYVFLHRQSFQFGSWNNENLFPAWCMTAYT